VYIPSLGHDPETIGMTLTDQVATLINYLRRDDPDSILPTDVLDFVLVDRTKGNYPGGVDEKTLTKMGLDVLDVNLFETLPGQTVDPGHLAAALVSLT
jgi:hypothetical protein